MDEYIEYHDYNEKAQMVQDLSPGQTSSPISDLDMLKVLNRSIQRRTLRIAATGYNFTETSPDETRMTFNQITFAVMISILIVANMLLVWSLAYIVIFYERRGQSALKHHYTMLRLKSHSSSESKRSTL